MSYTKTQWVVNDTVTAEKMNHIEQGQTTHGPCVEFVEVVYDENVNNGYLNTTFAHLVESINSGRFVVFYLLSAEGATFLYPMQLASNDSIGYNVLTDDIKGISVWNAATANEHIYFSHVSIK